MIKIDFLQQSIVEKNFRGDNLEVLIPKTIDVLNELEDYWPLTLRQVYYRLVAAQVIDNNRNRYKALSVMLTKLRRLDIVPWEVIEDRTRRISGKRGWDSSGQFAEYEVEQFLTGYDRCLVQNQENFVEIFVEKDALATIFEDKAWPYCVRVVTCKGQVSSTYVNSYAERARAATAQGQKPIILYYGDLDPSGARIPVAIENNLWEHHDVDVGIAVVALTPEQVEKFDLPHSIDALKKTDPNYEWYARNFGKMAVELDALHPETLGQLVEAGLRAALDIEDMVEQQKIQTRERERLKKAKDRILKVIKEEKLI